MIRETYKGRQLKAVKGKSYAHSRITVNGTDCGEWLGTQTEIIEWAKRTIDDVDSRPFEGRWNECWYAPGTYELNEHGHIVAPGGICSCSYCEKRRIEPCANITAGGVCVCSHCMKPYLAQKSTEETVTEAAVEAIETPVAEPASEIETLIRWAKMRDKIKQVIENRQRTGRLGSGWRISDAKAPECFGVNSKSVIYVDDAAEHYEVHVYDFKGNGGLVASCKTIDAALRRGASAVGQPPDARAA